MKEENQKKEQIDNNIIPIIKNKLMFVVSDEPVDVSQHAYEFNIDEALSYTAFNEDFGPISIAAIYNYINSLKSILLQGQNSSHIFYHRTATDYKKYTNSIVLICAFQMIVMGRTPQKAFEPFQKFQIPAFLDSSSKKNNYECNIIHILKGLSYAISLGWFNLDKFNLEKYVFYGRVKNGDISEIIPQKMYGFSAPFLDKKDKYGNKLVTVKDCAKLLKSLGIKVVISLSKSTDYTSIFQKYGIRSHSVLFPEGSSPPQKAVEQFLDIIEKYEEREKIGVYCKSGLGKTPTMIGCYALKYYKFKAEEYIGWVRLCRPGSVQGSQHLFLKQFEQKLHASGQGSPIRKQVDLTLSQHLTSSSELQSYDDDQNQSPKRFANPKRLREISQDEASQKKPSIHNSQNKSRLRTNSKLGGIDKLKKIYSQQQK